MTFAREAWPFVLPVAVLAVAALALGWHRSGLALGLLAVLVLAFFRVPSRAASGPPDALLAPANGKVTGIELVSEPLMGDQPVRRISTFLSVFNVHVQRAPTAGTVETSEFRPGRKVAAFRPDAGEINESHFVVLETPGGDRIGVKQIAGLVARRVVSYLEAGSRVQRGELIGVIKFGSRVDLYLPPSYEILIRPGDTVTEGLTAVARAGDSATGDAAPEPRP